VRRLFAVCSTALIAAAIAGGASAAKPPLHVVVSASSHHPVVGKPWSYTVKVTSAGKPVASTVHIQVFFNGISVGEVGTHVLKNGVWKETIPATGKNAFPLASVGQQLVWHAIATAKGYAAGIGAFPISVVK
jgi:hypothetical protein